MKYTPMMSETAARRRIAWQERVYEGNLLRPRRLALRFFGKTIVVSRNVFIPGPPKYNLLARALLKEVRPYEKVLDMGTGSGAQAILAASKGANVTAVDVNPFAVACAKSNFKRNGLESRIEVFESNLFERVKGRFDLIVFDPPFRWTDPRDSLERASADKDYKTLKSFLSGARNRLRHGGRILMTFGTSGDIAYFRYLIKQNGFKSGPMFKSHQSSWTYYAYKLT